MAAERTNTDTAPTRTETSTAGRGRNDPSVNRALPKEPIDLNAEIDALKRLQEELTAGPTPFSPDWQRLTAAPEGQSRDLPPHSDDGAAKVSEDANHSIDTRRAAPIEMYMKAGKRELEAKNFLDAALHFQRGAEFYSQTHMQLEKIKSGNTFLAVYLDEKIKELGGFDSPHIIQSKRELHKYLRAILQFLWYSNDEELVELAVNNSDEDFLPDKTLAQDLTDAFSKHSVAEHDAQALTELVGIARTNPQAALAAVQQAIQATAEAAPPTWQERTARPGQQAKLTVPRVAPELYGDRPTDAETGKRENIAQFLERVWYDPWIKEGLLNRVTLNRADPQAATALTNFLRTEELPEHLRPILRTSRYQARTA